MSTTSSIQFSLQKLNQTAFSKHKVFLYPESAFDIGAITKFLFEGKIRQISAGINEDIEEAEIEFPSKAFGTHITWMTPFSIAVDSIYNTIFKGFITDETAILDRSNDQISATAVGYKWLIGKLSKIRGKIYTVNNYVAPKPGFLFTNTRVFTNLSLFEKFRYTIPGGMDNGLRSPTFQINEGTGFLGGCPTIFNENGDPDCAAKDVNSNYAVAFKFDADDDYIDGLRIRAKYGDNKYYWTYSTMLMYIARFYIENYFQGFFGTTRLEFSRSSLINIQRYGNAYGRQYIIPLNFDITGLTPTQAIDKIVKSIPGSWSWRLNYSHFSKVILIEVNNNYEDVYSTAARKNLYIGKNEKINAAGNNVNVAAITARRSIRDAISHAVAVGSNIEIETTIQYLPGWKQYIRPYPDADPFSDNYSEYDGATVPNGYQVSNFKNGYDFICWTQWYNKAYEAGVDGKKLKEIITDLDELRYSQIFRLFTFPKKKTDLINFPTVNINSLIPSYYQYVNYLHELIFNYVIVPRKVMNPVTNYKLDSLTLKDSNITDELSNKNRNMYKESSNPLFVFLYDDLAGSPLNDDGDGTAEEQAVLDKNKWLIADGGDEDSDLRKTLSHSFDSENRVILFEHPQFEQAPISVRYGNDKAEPQFMTGSRRVFVTCRIQCDVPLIKDKIDNQAYYGNARLVSQDIIDEAKAVLRVNAYFPTPSGYDGDSLEYTDYGEGTTGVISRSAGSNLLLGSKLIDWNRCAYATRIASVTQNLIDVDLIIDNTNLLQHVIEIMLGSTPLYTEEFDVDLGRIDASYKIGDKIENIVNSEDENGEGGYHNMDAIIQRIQVMPVGEGDLFTTRMQILNHIPPNLPKMLERRI